MGRFGSGSVDTQFRRYKRRLKWLLQTTADSQDAIVEILRARHLDVSRATVSRWMQEESSYAPNSRELLALMMSHEDASMDWLFGRRAAESVTERFIEGKIV